MPESPAAPSSPDAARHGRLPWPVPADLSPQARAVYDTITTGPRTSGRQSFQVTDSQGRLHGPFNAMLMAPVVGEPLQQLGAALRYRSHLTARARETAILAVAAARRSDFEWYAHALIGSQVGLSANDLAALRVGQAPPGATAVERTVHRMTTRLAIERDLDDEEHRDAVDALGEEVLMELVVLVGYYDMLDLVLRTWRVPLPDGASSPFA